MADTASDSRPEWVSDSLYPFQSRFFAAPAGRMHYLDEGSGVAIVFVHGNPSWSFEFRHLVAKLRGRFRCVAPDHLGFGLSARSDRPEDHHPASHAGNFAALLDHLDLRDVTLFLADWGGPIGLDFARRHPERVSRIVIANTWAWPVNRDFHFVSFSFLMGCRLGRLMIERFNVFVNKVMPAAFGDRSLLTSEVMEHYRRAQPTPAARQASSALPRHIVGASEWLSTIWNDREAFAGKPALLLWGFRDIAFRRKELEVWKSALHACDVHEFPDCGHFLAEEAPDEIAALMRTFMSDGERLAS